MTSIYWYSGRGSWSKSAIGDWDEDALSFSIAQWIDKHAPVGALNLGGTRLAVYAHPRGFLAVAQASKARGADRFMLTLRDKFEIPSDVVTRKVVLEVSAPDGWGVREILSGPPDVMAHVEWDPEERRFVTRGAPEWSIVKQRKLPSPK